MIKDNVNNIPYKITLSKLVHRIMKGICVNFCISMAFIHCLISKNVISRTFFVHCSLDKDNVKKIRKCKLSTDVREVRRFLEIAQYYQIFIKGFADIARSLNNLIRK